MTTLFERQTEAPRSSPAAAVATGKEPLGLWGARVFVWGVLAPLSGAATAYFLFWLAILLAGPV